MARSRSTKAPTPGELAAEQTERVLHLRENIRGMIFSLRWTMKSDNFNRRLPYYVSLHKFASSAISRLNFEISQGLTRGSHFCANLAPRDFGLAFLPVKIF